VLYVTKPAFSFDIGYLKAVLYYALFFHSVNVFLNPVC
jgi:hypothetical protein